MKQKNVKIADLIEIPEFRNFYAPQPIDDLVQSYELNGQWVPIYITEKNEIVNGYRMVDAIKRAGGLTVKAMVVKSNPTIYDRILLNQFRPKTTEDQILEIEEIFKKFPKRQGKKGSTGINYVRDELISAALNHRFKGDKVIKKLEDVVKNDLEGKVLSKGIIEKYWKVDTCEEFLKVNRKIDQEKKIWF